jgi:hypothetical protein
VLGPTEVLASLGAFAAVLLAGGWTWGADPSDGLLATASGTAFAAIVLGQLANAFACRSEARPVHRMDPFSNRLLPIAVAVELALLAAFLGVPVIATALGGSWPSGVGWLLAAAAIPMVLLADTVYKMAVGTGRRRTAEVN